MGDYWRRGLETGGLALARQSLVRDYRGCQRIVDGRVLSLSRLDRFWHTFTVTACRPRVSVDEGRLAVPMGED